MSQSTTYCPIVYSIFEQMGGTVTATQKSSTCCGWNGVACHPDGRIFRIGWPGQNLVGEIPADIGKLQGLQRLNFARNRLSGSIPENFYLLVNLTNIHFAVNQLSGSISPSIGQLVNLQYFSLQTNRFTGTLPQEVGNLKKIIMFNVVNNQLTGNIPAALASLPALSELYLNNNQFTGWPSALNDLKIKSLVIYPNPGLPKLPFDIVAQNPAEVLKQEDLTALLSVAPSKRQQGARLPTYTREELYSMCPWDKITRSDVVAGCLVGIYQTHCLQEDLWECHNSYTTVIENSHFASLSPCSAWKSGPRSDECVSAIRNFPVIELPHITLTPAVALQFVQNVIANKVFSPCFSEDCRW
jgi:hypothetical protein